MASETNELTFVRCPTCRSLVPASASRCRICNATLEVGEQKPPSSDQAAAAARVRQKTVTATPEEVRNFTSGSADAPQVQTPPPVQSPKASQPPPASPASAGSSQVNDDSFDPLGAFLNDLDSVDPAPKAAAPKSAEKPPVRDPIDELFGDDDEDEEDDGLAAALASGVAEDDDLDDFDLDIFDDPSFDELGEIVEDPPVQAAVADPEPPPQAPPRQAPPRQAPPRQAPPAPQDSGRGVEARDRQQQPQSQKPPRAEERPAPGGQRQPEQRKQQTAPPQRSPSMGMRPKQPQAPKHEVRPTPAAKPPAPTDLIDDPPSRVMDRPRGAASPGAPRPSENRDAQRNVGKNQQNQQARRPDHSDKRDGRDVRADGGRGERQERRAERAPDYARPQEDEVQSPVSAAGPKLSKMKPGRLFGWLVSFESPDGRAIELRSGRFFVTGTSIRGSDLILEDQSISTPHALMSINEKGFLLQDLMSDRGTFVRSQGEAQYRREESIIEVQHGDWIRFGDVEFLVTIVPA